MVAQSRPLCRFWAPAFDPQMPRTRHSRILARQECTRRNERDVYCFRLSRMGVKRAEMRDDESDSSATERAACMRPPLVRHFNMERPMGEWLAVCFPRTFMGSPRLDMMPKWKPACLEERTVRVTPGSRTLGQLFGIPVDQFVEREYVEFLAVGGHPV